HLVDLRHLDREQTGPAERGRADERAEPDRRRLARDGAERDPGVGRAGEPVATHREEVVGAEERVEAELLGRLRDGELVGVAGALLGLGEDPEVHGPSLPGDGARARRRPAAPERALGVSHWTRVRPRGPSGDCRGLADAVAPPGRQCRPNDWTALVGSHLTSPKILHVSDHLLSRIPTTLGPTAARRQLISGGRTAREVTDRARSCPGRRES